MSVEIKIYGEDARHALRELRDFAAGALPQVTGPAAGEMASVVSKLAERAADAVAEAVEPPAATQEAREADAAVGAPKRERGKPSPGRARRTKEEIAEDEAAEAADQAAYAKQQDAETLANISTGEARVDPANPEPEDSPEDQAQDAADEAEEVEAARDAEKPLTNDDLKAEMTAYVKRFGMPAVQGDGSRIFAAALGAPPAGEAAWKLSLVGDDQVLLGKAVAAWREALAKNPFNREAVSK